MPTAILGEFGAFKDLVKKDDDGIDGAAKRWTKVRGLACGKYGFTGYLGWSLETFEQQDIYQALAFPADFMKSFRAGFSWQTVPEAAADPAAAARIPIALGEVKPTGKSGGFIAPPDR